MSAPTADRIAPLVRDPARAAILLDIDGTLAPIVERAENAHVREESSKLLGRLARRYQLVACISGRSAAEARRLVGVGSIAYAGSHGAELLEAGASKATTLAAFASWEDCVRGFAAEQDTPELRVLRVRMEDKGPIVAFHWRGTPDEEASRTRLEGLAAEAESAGFATHWGRKVLEVRPPVPVDKGQAVRTLCERARPAAALYAGDDATDLDAFAALRRMRDEGLLETVICVGVRSDEGPTAIVDSADLAVDGVAGVVSVLEAL
ncbi:MAG TPA: trehalose-phosphatase [Thermoleophilaceae bacterium]|nr:trehalose-phosphatase [Thermoleophilaceae bacterium]